MPLNWFNVVEAGLRARNRDHFNDDGLLPIARVIRTGQAVNSSNWLAAIGLAFWDTIVFECCFEAYPILKSLRPLTFLIHFVFALLYSQGQLFNSIYRYASRDSADDEEGLILGSHIIWLLIYMGGALLCHNITMCFWFLWNIIPTVLPFISPLLIIIFISRYMGRDPSRYIQLGYRMFFRILFYGIGYMIQASKTLTRLTFSSAYSIWNDLFCRNDNHDQEIPRYIHEPLWDQRCIRLLKVSRRLPFGPVQYELSLHGIDSRPSYEAISYTWGDGKMNQSITISDSKLTVTSNAYNVLQDRATFWKSRTIWMDSICINQADELEKGSQIPLMREIYSRASRVLVWLGSEPDSRIAMGFIANLNRRLRFGGLHGTELKTILQIGSKSPKWPALFSLLNHPYWTRSWIIQEIAVPETVHIYYGGAIITFEYFTSTIEMLHNQDVGSLFIISYTDVNPRTLPFRGSDCIRQISRIRSTIQQYSYMELFELLYSSNQSEAKEAKDKIFALLGIADLAAQNSLSGLYNTKVQEIFTSATRHLLSQQEPLRVLHHAGIGQRRKTEDLPSWSPDWNSSSGSRNFWRNSEGGPYRASGVTTLRLNFHPTSPTIQIRGQYIDQIEQCGSMWRDQVMDETTSLFEKAKERMLALDDATALTNSFGTASTAYKHGQSRDEALWRTLIGDRADIIRPVPAHYRESYDAASRIIAANRGSILGDGSIVNNKDFKQIFQQIYPGVLLEDLPASIRADDFLARKFWNGAGDGLHRRKFAVSKREGYFMLVPELANPGDLICLFWGAQTPFLVRRVEEEGVGEGGDHRFQLVGECYVHGIMDGEAVSYENSQTFTLV